MKILNLITENNEQERIKEYLENNVNEILAEKINNGVYITKDDKRLLNKKDLNGFWNYATEEAKKIATKNSRGAYVNDDTVFGWAMHYFEEDSIEGTLYNEDGTEYKPVIKKTTKPTVTTPTPYAPPVKKPEPQMSLFDMLAPKEEKKEEPKPVIEEDKPTLSYKAQLATQSQPDPLDDEPSEEDVQEAFEELEKEENKEQEEKPTSPIYAKYLELQKQYPYSIIAYRLGDFYEVFGDGATKISDPLDLTLTGRDFGLKERVPMVGFPFHVREQYFEKIAKFSGLVIYDNNNITIYTCDKKPCSIDMETGEITNNETSNPIHEDLLKIFGKDMEIQL